MPQYKAIWLLFLLLAGCQSVRINSLPDRLIPSNDRDWNSELAQLPSAEIEGDRITLRNIRNCNYVTENDYILEYFDRRIDVSEIRSVDYIVVPFQAQPMLAHTMLSFELSDGSYIAVSAEIRKEKGEDYSPFLGISNQFELTYVVATEQDLIRLRTRHRDAQVHVYPTVASPHQAQQLFLSIMDRINQLAIQPEFYHTLANNCTTNIFNHVQQLQSEQNAIGILQYSWQVLLPGFSDRLAFEKGLLKTSLSFQQTKQLALVNDLAEIHFDDPDFSRKIRTRHQAMLDGTDQNTDQSAGQIIRN